MTMRSANDLDGLAVMLSEFASSCYDHGVLATHSNTSLFETADIVSILSGGQTVPLTGFDAFDEDIAETEATTRILALLRPDTGRPVTIVAGDACITMGPGRPFVRATRPTRDVLVIETGGSWPSRMLIIVDRLRGLIDTGTAQLAA